MAKAPKSFSEVARGYANLWKKTELVKRTEAINIADRILKCLPAYESITKATGVPGWVIGILHYRESSLSFNTYLGNGQPLNRKTTIAPKNRGPFKSFYDGAVDALKYEGFDKVRDWSAARFLYETERWNGWGYFMRGVNAPYVWGGTNHQQPGKFIHDGPSGWRPNVMDTQLGSAAILKALCERSIPIAKQVNPDVPAAQIVKERAAVQVQPRSIAMSSVTPSQVSGVIRVAIGMFGGFLIGKGYITADSLHTLTDALSNSTTWGGLVMALGAAGWSAWSNNKTNLVASAAALPEVEKIHVTDPALCANVGRRELTTAPASRPSARRR